MGETAVTVLPRPRAGSDQTPGGRTECLDLSPEGFFRGAGCRKARGQKVMTGQQTCPPLPSSALRHCRGRVGRHPGRMVSENR